MIDCGFEVDFCSVFINFFLLLFLRALACGSMFPSVVEDVRLGSAASKPIR